ncbi:MAG: hypothetical protein ACO32S_08945, partial [Steroidobacteraceae bacterium]
MSRVSRAVIVFVLLAGISLGVAETANAAGKTLRALSLQTSTEGAGPVRVAIEVEADTVPKFFVLERPLRAVIDFPGTQKPS